MNEKYVCGICKKEYTDLNKYLACVFKCGSELNTKRKKEEEIRLKEMNDALSKVKEAKEFFEKKLSEFKKTYPEAYKLNFEHTECGDVCKECEDCSDECNEADRCDDCCCKNDLNKKSFEFEYFNNGKDKPKMSAKINGKETDDILKMMEEDPDTKYIAKLLGIL